MRRRTPIRIKVAAALALPLAGLVVAAAIGVSATTSMTDEVTRQTGLAGASVGHAGLIGALQDERNLALLTMLGLTDAIELEVTDPALARTRTNIAADALHHSVEGQQDRLREDYARALGSLDDLSGLREQVDRAATAPGMANRDAADLVFSGYTSIVSTLFASHDRFALEVVDARIGQGDDLVHYGSHANDSVAQLVARTLFIGTGPGGVDRTGEAAEIAALARDVARNQSAVQVRGTGDYAPAAEALAANPRVEALPVVVDAIVSEGAPVEPRALLSATPLGPDGGYPAFRDDVVEVLDARAAELDADAEARRRLYVGGALAVVLAALAIAWRVSRSITRPLRDLSVEARAMASDRLPAAVHDILDAPSGEDLVVPAPDPIRVRASDEVADVAGAFNDVQSSAISLAVEQAALRRNVAESYVNLGRRNQNLLGRLLGVVGELERDERDPGRLAKLYKLDHLATRLRRNADSLLVLSETRPTTTSQAPVPVSDVVRAALGEVEHYERVLVRTLDPTDVVGSAAADLAHLLAELVENGLRHSPPRELVEVTGIGGPDGYTITIVDHGLGMTADEIEQANQRLAGAESFTVTPARYLGHYVTAVLAARHDIGVRLRGSTVVGIAAVVDLPAALVAGPALPERAEPRRLAPVPPTPPTPPPPRARGGVDFLFIPPLEADGGADSFDPVGPSADAVRSAVAILRDTPPATRRSTSGTPVGAAGHITVAPPRAIRTDTGGARAVVGDVVPPARWPASAPLAGLATPVSAGPLAARATMPTRTASGLVRRVRGASFSVGAVAARAASDRRPAPEVPDEASSTVVDGVEFQRFLSNLTGGVQRRLDERGAAEDREC